MCFVISTTCVTHIVLAAFQVKNGHGYQIATTSLSAEQQTRLMEVMRIAQEHEASAGQS